MKQEINETMEWLAGLVKKYGFWIGLAVALYFGIKKVWFWFVMPSMLLVMLNMLATTCGWKWTTNLDVKSVIISWVFVFGLLSCVFARDKK